MSSCKEQLDAVTLYLKTLAVEVERCKTDEYKRNLGERGQYDAIRWRQEVIHDLTERMKYPDGFELPVFRP